ncbi:MAG: hypothetical protein R3181_06475 [Rubricoccaceae bacterium]|nr:hypothetical protein [Rubricoccaceae bacterium]
MPGLRTVLPAILSLGLAVGCADPALEAGAWTDETVREAVDAAQARLDASAGGRLVLRAIDAHGGLEAWYRAPTSAFTWGYANQEVGLAFASSLVADNRTRQVYHDLHTLGPYAEPRPVEGRFAWDGTDAWIAPASAHIPPFNPRFWATTGYYFELIPFVFADPGLRYERLPADTLDGRLHERVRVTFEPGTGDSPLDAYTVYLDPETSRVAAVRYIVTYGRIEGLTEVPDETLLRYEGYVTVDGLTVPTRLRGYPVVEGRAGPQVSEAWADSLSFRRPFDPSRLEAPAGARVALSPLGD